MTSNTKRRSGLDGKHKKAIRQVCRRYRTPSVKLSRKRKRKFERKAETLKNSMLETRLVIIIFETIKTNSLGINQNIREISWIYGREYLLY